MRRLIGVPLIGKWHNYSEVANELRRIEFTVDGRVLDTDAVGPWVTRYKILKPGLLQVSRAGMIDQINYKINGEKLYLYHGPSNSIHQGDPFVRD